MSSLFSGQRVCFVWILGFFFVIFAVLLWWTNTVLSVLLIAIALAIFVLSCCQEFPSDEIEVEERTKIKRQRVLTPVFDDDDQMDIEFGEFDASLSGQIDESRIPSGLPVEIIEGMNPSYVGRLHEAGIERLTDIIDSDPEEIAEICDIELPVAKKWIADSTSLVIGAGIDDLLSLSKSDPVALLVRIEQSIEDGKINIPADYKITEEITKAWVLAARDELVRLGIKDSDGWVSEK